MLWQVDIYPTETDREANRVSNEAAELGICDHLEVHAAHGYLIEGNINADDAAMLAKRLLADGVVERTVVAPVGTEGLLHKPPQSSLNGDAKLLHVMPKPGAMDPVAKSAESAIRDYGCDVAAVRTFQKYWLGRVSPEQLDLICGKILANDSIEQVVVGPLELDQLVIGFVGNIV